MRLCENKNRSSSPQRNGNVTVQDLIKEKIVFSNSTFLKRKKITGRNDALDRMPNNTISPLNVALDHYRKEHFS